MLKRTQTRRHAGYSNQTGSIISVIEASNETELGQALAIEAENVYPELMNKYLVRLAATDKADLTARHRRLSRTKFKQVSLIA